jgi:hypothetical protein
MFNPKLQSNWIPTGLPYDLWDNRNDISFGNEPQVRDLVFGFSIQQIFRALQNDVRSVPNFRQKLLLQNSNLQFNQVNALFEEYGY